MSKRNGKIILPKRVVIHRGDEPRMPVSGMLAKQALNEARRWWNKTGRDHMRAARDRKHDGIRDDKEIMAKSGILAGKMFDECSKSARADIVKRWHRAWCAMELGITDDDAFERAGIEEEYCAIVEGN